MPWNDTELDIAYQIDGGSYLRITPYLSDFTLENEALLTDFTPFGPWPVLVETGHRASVSISGLLTGIDDTVQDMAENVLENNRRAAAFMFAFPDHNFLGPVGYIEINESSIPNNDGVMVIDSAARAQNTPGFEKWRFGRITGENPVQAAFANSPVANSQLLNPIAGQWVLIHVADEGDLTALEITYKHGANEYAYAVPIEMSKIKTGVHIAQLKTATDAVIPATELTGGQWKIARTGTVGTAEYYIGFIEF